MTIKKFLVGLAVVAMVFSAVAVSDAKAQMLSAADIDALAVALNMSASQKALLMAMVGGSNTGVSAAGACAFSGYLTLGSTGSQVTCLQQYLEAGGHLVMPTGVSYGYFGDLTGAAVVRWQTANGISPTAPSFGPMSIAKYNMLSAGAPTSSIYPAGCTSMSGFSVTTGMPCSGGSNLPAGCTSVAGFSPTTGMSCSGGSTPTPTPGLSGGAGSIQSVELMSAFSDEEVGEGQSDVEVIGVELEAEDGSDLSLDNVRVVLTHSVAPNNSPASSNRFDRYADEVIVMLDGREVGSASARDFSRSSAGVYTRTISLSGAVIRAGETGELTVAITSVSNLDSADEGEGWGIELTSVRYQDASGAILTESLNNIDRVFTFESLATASSLKLRLSVASGNPAASTIKVDDTTRTNDVELFRATFRADGSDLWIDELPVLLTTTGATTSDVVVRAKLQLGSRTFTENLPASCSSSDSCTVVFDDMDYDLNEGNSVTVRVFVDVKGSNNNYDSGQTITGAIGATQRGNIVVEDMNGDNLASGDRTGSITGNQMTLRSEGIEVNLTSKSGVAKTTGGNTPTVYGEYTFNFSITADDEDLYIDKTTVQNASPSMPGNGAGLAWASTTHSGTVGTTTVTFSASSNSQNPTSNDLTNSYRVAAGTSRNFTVTIVIEAVTTFSNDVRVTGINYTTNDNDVNADIDDYYTDLENFEITGVTVVK